MKFNEVEASTWLEMRRYFDTCLLPVTAMSGGESPAEATAELERLRDLMDKIELPFKGRTVTYPALHYCEKDESAFLNTLCRRFKASGYRYVVLLTARAAVRLQAGEADLIIAASEDELPSDLEVRQAVQAMWQAGA
ncbi:DUF2487 family protein [Paenibacillus sp. IB182496]|uniref:DUF2487 family protein n=1 Tax=Paenibacillus sabuli TaxID=2772509 RepID=A0A927BQZ8_9BACL|nr:DUF2487 family protein [Paenibacillus sabuli]MBD2845143.1 DUF2487 family protein [Paenibacillus sabuli]